MTKKWEMWKNLVRAHGSQNMGQLKEILHSVKDYPDYTQEVVAGALSVARVMLEVEEGAPVNTLAFCLLHSDCESCLLVEPQRTECSVGEGYEDKVEKALRAYDALYENYLQGDG